MHGVMPVIHNSTARNTDSHGDALQTEEGSRKLCSYLYIEIWVGGTRKFVSHSTYLYMNNEPANLPSGRKTKVWKSIHNNGFNLRAVLKDEGVIPELSGLG